MIMNTMIQLIVFCSIPFIWWIITSKKEVSFFSWVGLYIPQLTKKKIISGLMTLMVLLLPGMYIMFVFEDKSLLANAQFANTGLRGLFSLIIYAVIQTGLAEEIFFRGFLTKRLMKKCGLFLGITIQALVFGFLHGVMLFWTISPILVLLTIIFTSFAGYMMAYINESLSEGSIIPSWIIHSLVNIISSLLFWIGIF